MILDKRKYKNEIRLIIKHHLFLMYIKKLNKNKLINWKNMKEYYLNNRENNKYYKNTLLN